MVAEKLQSENFSIPEAVVTRWNSKCLTVSKVLGICIPNTLLNDVIAPNIFANYDDLENELRICKYTKPLSSALINSLLRRFSDFFFNLDIPIHDNVKHRSKFFLMKCFLLLSFLDDQFRLRWIIRSNLPENTK